MSWEDRIIEAAYNSPDGDRIPFFYEDVGREGERKGTAFDFPDTDGTYIQDLGSTGRRYPLRAIFWGENYDIEATAFEDAINVPGVGKLEHPIYGVIDVVPLGVIRRRDDLKTAANQAIIELTFWNTIGVLFPTGQADVTAGVLNSVSQLNVSSAASFNDLVDIDTVIEETTLENRFAALLGASNALLKPIADANAEVSSLYNNSFNSLNSSIGLLVENPLVLAGQLAKTLQLPSTSIALFLNKIAAYSQILSAITGSVGATRLAANKNEFATDIIYAENALAGEALSSVDNEFKSKPEALSAAENLLEEFELFIEWKDNNLENLEIIDTGTSYQQLQEVIAITAGALVEISFSLAPERRIVLDRDRTIIDLVAELYGEVDAQLDFFINSNNLSGSEILELPAGKEVVYFA